MLSVATTTNLKMKVDDIYFTDLKLESEKREKKEKQIKPEDETN